MVQCFGFKKQRLVHCVDVTFACNDLGLACRAYLGGSRLRIQEPKIGAPRCCGLLTLVKLERWLYEVKKGCRDKYPILFSSCDL